MKYAVESIIPLGYLYAESTVLNECFSINV